MDSKDLRLKYSELIKSLKSLNNDTLYFKKIDPSDFDQLLKEPQDSFDFRFRIFEDRFHHHIAKLKKAMDFIESKKFYESKIKMNKIFENSEIVLENINKSKENLTNDDKRRTFEAFNEALTGLATFQSEIGEILEKEKIRLKKLFKYTVKNIPSGNYLYHAIKGQYVEEILKRGSILGHTTQRYWEDGRRYKDKSPDYEKSYWMKGVSLTRSLPYALSWASVILIFDRDKITKKYKLENYNWGNHFDSENPKRETEEFLVLSKTGKRFKNYEDPEKQKEYDEALAYFNSPEFDVEENSREEYQNYLNILKKSLQNNDMSKMKNPEGEFNFSENDILVGIILNSHTLDIYGIDDPLIQEVIKHPKFLGINED